MSEWGMTFKEVSSWIVLAAMALVFTGYASDLWAVKDFGAETTGRMAWAMAGFVMVVVIAHIAVAILAPKLADEAADERDKRIALYGERAASLVFGLAMLNVLGLALFTGETLIANLIFLALVGSEIVKNLWQVALYRMNG